MKKQTKSIIAGALMGYILFFPLMFIGMLFIAFCFWDAGIIHRSLNLDSLFMLSRFGLIFAGVGGMIGGISQIK